MRPSDPWTPARLRQAIALKCPDVTNPAPEESLRLLEAHACARPADRDLHDLLLQAHRSLVAGAELPLVVAGVHREQLLLWDSTTTTWTGHDQATGRPARVRVLSNSGDTVARRALARDARACALVLPMLRQDPEAIAIVLGAEGEEPAPLTGFAQALDALDRWSAAGLGVPESHPSPLAVVGGALTMVSLTPGAHTSEVVIRAAAAWLAVRRPATDPLPMMLESWSPSDPEETRSALRRALAQDLAERWAGLHRVWLSQARGRRLQRLHSLIEQLNQALPAPTGRSALGVGLDGRTHVLEARGGRLTWGAPGEEQVVVDHDGVRKAVARQIVRTRAVRPPTTALQDQVGGDDAALDAITRWLAAASRLHGISVLVRAQSRVSP